MSARPLLLATALLGLTACKKSVEDPAPVQTGSYLVYEVVEQSGDRRLVHQVRLDFTVSDDTIAVNITGPKGKTSATTNRAGEPSDAALKVELEMFEPFEFGLLYLATKDRRQGVTTPGGKVAKKRKWQGRDAWALQQQGGMLQRFYDVDLGVLTGWNLSSGAGDVSARLVDSR